MRTRTLLALYLAGDGAAERRLFEQHTLRLLRRARGHRLMAYLKGRTTAEDLVDEVFLRAFSSGFLRERFRDRGRGSLEQSLSIILDRVLHDACRRHGALKRKPNGTHPSCDVHGNLAPEQSNTMSDVPTPSSQARAGELIELCRAHLEPREWEIWSQVELEGLDSEAVGQKLGLSSSAVRGVLFRARAKLVRLLRDSAGGSGPGEESAGGAGS